MDDNKDKPAPDGIDKITAISIVAFVFFMSFAILNFVIADEFSNHAGRCYDLADDQRTGAIRVEDGKAQFVVLANEQYQLMEVNELNCWKYPLWKIGILNIESPYTTYSEAVKGQLG